MPAQAVMTAPACRAFTTAFFRALRSRYPPDTIGMQNALYPSTRMTQGWDRAPFCFPKKVRILRLVGYNDEYLPAWILWSRYSSFYRAGSHGTGRYRVFWRDTEWQKRMAFLTQRVFRGGIIRRFLPRLFPGRTSTIGLNVHSVT